MSSYKYDTHVHTSESSRCGEVGAVDAVRMYKREGYSGIIITDHYSPWNFSFIEGNSWNDKIKHYLKGYKNAVEEGKKSGLSVFLGMELTFTESNNDYLVYGIDEDFLIEHPELYNLGLVKFSKLAKENGLLIFQAHPFRPGLTAADPSLIDGIEIYNGNMRHNSHNHLALEYAEENGLKMLSGSDFHKDEDFARGGIVVKTPFVDEKSFMAGLLECSGFEYIKVE